MSKGKQFWLDSWQQNRIPFHKIETHPDLLAFWPEMQVRPQSTILVPLCGKSLDLLWLVQQGYQVIGIELSEQAVVQFFTEQKIEFTKEEKDQVTCYMTDNLLIYVGDIFALNPGLIPLVDVIYDRAALVALPPKLRPAYSSLCLNWLKPQGSIFLNTLSYMHEPRLGPPYSVPPEEVAELYKGNIIRSLRAEKKERIIYSNQEEYSVVVDEAVWWISYKK